MSHSMQSALPSATTGPQSPERGATGRVRPAAARAGGRAAPGADRWVLTAALAIPAAVTLLHLPYYLVAAARAPPPSRPPPCSNLGPARPRLRHRGSRPLPLHVALPAAQEVALAGLHRSGWPMAPHPCPCRSRPAAPRRVHCRLALRGLIGLGYGAMFLVSLSGIVAPLPVHADSPQRERSRADDREAANERRALITRIAATTASIQRSSRDR